MQKSLIITAVILLCNACGVNHHLKRSKKHLDKAISKGYEMTLDSVWTIDTIFTEKYSLDTVLLKSDTIIIDNEELLFRLITTVDSIYVDGECKQDTIYIERVVTVQKDPIYIEKSFFNSIGDLTKIIGVIALIAISILVVAKFK